MAEETVFNLIDCDGDGLVSYSEFLLLLTLLSIPEQVGRRVLLRGAGQGDEGGEAGELLLVRRGEGGGAGHGSGRGREGWGGYWS